jgi:hypothetical protein
MQRNQPKRRMVLALWSFPHLPICLPSPARSGSCRDPSHYLSWYTASAIASEISMALHFSLHGEHFRNTLQ